MKRYIALSALLLSGCQDPPPPSDAQVARQFATHRPDFEAIVAAVYEAPAISRIELRNGPAEVKPVTVPEARWRPIVARMKAAGVSQLYVSPDADGKSVSFLVYSVGLGVSGRAKSIAYGRTNCPSVADTDEALAEAGGESLCVAKKLAENWNIIADQ